MRLLALQIACLRTLAACSGPPCVPERLDDDSSAGPGEVRYGVAIDQESGVTALAAATGVACVTCGGVWYFDPQLVEQRHVEFDFTGYGALAIGNDTSFVLDLDFGLNPETHGGESRPPHYQLTALSATGRSLWHDDFGVGDSSLAVGNSILAGPASVIVHNQSRASVFDAATGALRWTTPITRRDALAVDATGGLFVAGGAIASTPTAPTQATLRHLDATGAEIWSTTWAAGASLSFNVPEVAFDDAVIAGGGVLVVGRFLAVSLDVGARVLPAIPIDGAARGTYFIAALDDRGATQWVVTLGKADMYGYIEQLKVVPSRDGALICGHYAGPGQFGLPDTGGVIYGFVGRVDPHGAIVAHPVIGADVTCSALAAGTDDSAIVTMGSVPTDDQSAIRVGNRTFKAGGSERHNEFYVLDIVL
jgi:hypothetical protein